MNLPTAITAGLALVAIAAAIRVHERRRTPASTRPWRDSAIVVFILGPRSIGSIYADYYREKCSICRMCRALEGTDLCHRCTELGEDKARAVWRRGPRE